ncbi:MAG: 4Fe-4S dicluster domain-containing protein [Acidobacteriia bacterium]|jgi:molybdopterin-containing oxidoreductase family iron-sulfur binding subunit|nr:4Fe-4S dicluster domain-containing protein [Terriglobia bacterium]
MSDAFNRREFLKLVTIASTGTLAACSPAPPQKVIPYVIPPEEVVPGLSYWFKTTCRECPAGCGMMARTREGRVVKLEGNPEHPINRGALCVRGQAALQGLYNPDRLAGPLRRTPEGRLEPITWEQAEEALVALFRFLREQRRTATVALLTERISGATEKFFRDLFAVFPAGQVIQYEPFAYEALRAGNRVAFGTSEIPHYDIAAARMLVSFGADFLETWLSNVECARAFAAARRRHERDAMRFVAVEPRLSLTAANADVWLPARPGSEAALALALVHEILRSGRARISSTEAARIGQLVATLDAETAERLTDVPAPRIRALAREFAAADPGLALGPGVAASGPAATALQVAVNLLNYVCGNVNRTVQFGRGSSWDRVATHAEMLEFIERMRTGRVDVLFFHHTNPVYTLPPATGFARALQRVRLKVSFSPFLDETTAQCDLILPDHTPLERWEEYQPRAGIRALVQPAMAGGFHFQSRQAADMLLYVVSRADATLSRQFPFADFRAYLENEWRAVHRAVAPEQPFAEFWRSAVEAGGIWREVPLRPVRLSEAVFRFDFSPALTVHTERDESLALLVFPTAERFDGRGANRPWLQETPDAMTKIVWSAWAELHPETARRYGVREGDLLKVSSPHGTIQLPAHLTPTVRPDTVAIPLGQGHTSFGRWAADCGPTPLALLSAEVEVTSGGLLYGGTRVRIERLPVRRLLARTQQETSQHDREIARVVPLAELVAGSVRRDPEPRLSIYPEHTHDGHRWGMAIDLDACIGCNACVVACSIENNVPWVGALQVDRGRHMAWMRIDRYWEPVPEAQPVGGVAPLETHFLPMLCQHCDHAPCESVCPVYATYHNHEGLNVQVYNRCVGTRYCSNNCPYKVRRFHWFDDQWPWPLALGLNPDVTARTKGVMGKCTFCVQRIRTAKDQAKDENRTVRDGEIIPACAQTCPAEAIVFGDLNDPNSRVRQLADSARGYHVLGELNTRPAITYLKKVRRSGLDRPTGEDG